MMSNMTSSQGIGLIFIMLMIIGMVNGRWLEVDNLSTSMISDGLHDQALENPPNLHMVVSNSSESTITLYAEKRCQSIYGFLPCADTMQEGVFLMLTYTYLMMLGEEWIHKGSQDLFMLLGDKAIGASVFRVLMALPRIVIVIVSGVLATASDAQNQVAFGVGMYAGSTVISLTLIWGFRIILSRDKLRGVESTPEFEHQQHSTTNYFSCKQIISLFTDTGVNIDKETGKLAVNMLLSTIPFATIQLASLIKIPGYILLALIVSIVSLLLCFGHQLRTPLIQARTMAYLKQGHLRARFFYHVQRLAGGELIDEHGNPNLKAFESVFKRADTDSDGRISEDELEHLIQEVFALENNNQLLSREYASAEILTHFDCDKSGKINLSEFKKGCTKWLEKWKNEESNPDTVSKNLWKQAKFEKDSSGEIDAPMKMRIHKTSILYVVFGVGIIYLISGAFIQSVIQFSNAAHIPFLFTSFVVAPLAMNTKMIITALLDARPSVSMNASLTFSEIYNGLVMNNLLGLTTLLVTVYIKGLLWSYSVEVLTIMTLCIIIGLFAFRRNTYPLWASIVAMLLYPISIYIYSVFEY
ncbi:hypothetical protein Lser_V15G03950 [Lactuca serriola]